MCQQICIIHVKFAEHSVLTLWDLSVKTILKNCIPDFLRGVPYLDNMYYTHEVCWKFSFNVVRSLCQTIIKNCIPEFLRVVPYLDKNETNAGSFYKYFIDLFFDITLLWNPHCKRVTYTDWFKIISFRKYLVRKICLVPYNRS